MKKSIQRKTADLIIILFFLCYSAICLIPILHVLAVSLSSSTSVSTGKVILWPKEFTWKSYEYVVAKKAFWTAFGVTIKRTCLGLVVNMTLVTLAAFPMSKTQGEFFAKKFFVVFFMITMLFSGGLIPTFMVVKYTGLLNTIWALIIPGGLSVYNMILLMNFFKGIPKEFEESVFMDGGGYVTSLLRIYIPLSKPSLATLTVFSLVGHWNAWFDGMIYMSDSKNYPMQTYLQAVLASINTKMMTKAKAQLLAILSDRTLKCAQIFIAMLPILIVYPFLQKYFVKGMTLGGVKG